MTALLRTLPLVLALALTACDSGDPDDPTAEFQIGGDYSAVTETFSNGETRATYAIPTTQSGESFSYTLTVRTDRDGTVTSNTSTNTGTYNHPSIRFTTDAAPLSGTVESNGNVLKIPNPNGGDFTFLR